MKKSLLFLPAFILFLTITSCSSDDKENVSDDKGYCNVTINGETLHHEFEEGETFSLGANSCDNNVELINQSVEQFEKSNYFLDIGFIHKESKQQLQGYDINNTIVKSQFAITNSCYNNFDLIVEYTDNATDRALSFNGSSNNSNKIESVSVYKEDSEEIIYAVKGNFEVTYKKSDNTLIPAKGDYKFFIYVLK